MFKKKKQKNLKELPFKKRKSVRRLFLPEETKKLIWGIIVFLLSLIFVLTFFGKAGWAGRTFFKIFYFLFGKTIFVVPLILAIASAVFFFTKYQKIFWAILLAAILLLLGFTGILGEGRVGYFLNWPFLKLFGSWVTQIVFGGITLVGGLILWHLLKKPVAEEEPKPSLIKKIFAPSFKIKEIESSPAFGKDRAVKEPFPGLKTKPVFSPLPSKTAGEEYQTPPIELLESEKGKPLAGDVRQNSFLIKKTLENFGIPAQMSEVNIGPTVTQYTLKPAEGIKLSKITSLSNDLSLALASHPIRIEAPIPGKSLVGIEVPNKIRARVRLKDLISGAVFQQSASNLTFCLGRDVSGSSIYADLARMPHLLVAGSTGTGKTIFLNNFILSLIYRNSPQILRFILIDPKRVEFPVYNELPHLLCPVIFDVQKTINALKWLTGEMERRFEMLAEAKARDIASYNALAAGNSELETMPYIVLVIDELADLMAARSKEVEAGVVRLAQMARAAGIHLVVATQRPSVEVITGLIKANITSRITFQVASQVDSRTILDMAGAEKLLGSGDLLFLSAENPKPKRIQGAFVSEKEVKKVINWLRAKTKFPLAKIGEEDKSSSSPFATARAGEEDKSSSLPAEALAEVKKRTKFSSPFATARAGEDAFENGLADDLEKCLATPTNEAEFYGASAGEDPLYEEAKRVITKARKASASLLQRKLRIGYARAARLLDILEEKGMVGPAEGAKPRQVYFPSAGEQEEKDSNDDNGWRKV